MGKLEANKKRKKEALYNTAFVLLQRKVFENYHIRHCGKSKCGKGNFLFIFSG